MSKFNELLEALANAKTEEEKLAIRAEYEEFRKTITKDEFWKLIDKKSEEIKEELNSIQAQDSILIANGIEYPMTEWITIKRYCTLHGLKESAVSNRIRRGALPKEVVIELPYLNNLKLIQRSYKWNS